MSAGAAGKGTDASGNPILEDIGTYLRDAFKRRLPGTDVKYIGGCWCVCVCVCACLRVRVHCRGRSLRAALRAGAPSPPPRLLLSPPPPSHPLTHTQTPPT